MKYCPAPDLVSSAFFQQSFVQVAEPLVLGAVPVKRVDVTTTCAGAAPAETRSKRPAKMACTRRALVAQVNQDLAVIRQQLDAVLLDQVDQR